MSFCDTKQMETFRELELSESGEKSEGRNPLHCLRFPFPTIPAVRFEDRKEINKMISRCEKQVAEIEAKITALQKVNWPHLTYF